MNADSYGTGGVALARLEKSVYCVLKSFFSSKSPLHSRPKIISNYDQIRLALLDPNTPYDVFHEISETVSIVSL